MAKIIARFAINRFYPSFFLFYLQHAKQPCIVQTGVEGKQSARSIPNATLLSPFQIIHKR